MREGEKDPRVETYQMTQVAEEGRMISYSKALKEYKLAATGVVRGIYEFRGEPRPNGVHKEMEIVTFGTK